MNTREIGQAVVYGTFSSLGLMAAVFTGYQLINCDWCAFAKDTAATVKSTVVQGSKIAVSSVIPLGLGYCVNDYYKGTYTEYSAIVPYGALVFLGGYIYFKLFTPLLD